jgi:4-hydroxy-L-threonine phosphate dehydrogenase PdxA
MKPNIALVIGDPAGVGPELIVKLLADEGAGAQANIFVIGNRATLADAERAVGHSLNIDVVSQSAIGTRDFSQPVMLEWAGLADICDRASGGRQRGVHARHAHAGRDAHA